MVYSPFLIRGDCIQALRCMDGESVQCVVTSPPYWGLRDYGVAGQLGLEPTPEDYVSRMVAVFREVRRVLRADGTLWLNLGDCYASSPPGCGADGVSRSSTLHGHVSERYRETLRSGHGQKRNTVVGNLKPKDLVGIPWRVAFALQADGWYLRSDIIWAKPNPMPESVTDRPTKAHEYLFLLSKSARYRYDADAIKEPAESDGDDPRNRWDRDYPTPPGQKPQKRPGRSGNTQRTHDHNRNGDGGHGVPWEGTTRNRRSVWTVATRPYPGAHFATFPPNLIEPCIKAGARPGDMVLDPFMGSGTTGRVAMDLGCRFAGIELSASYMALAQARMAQGVLPLGGPA